MTSSIHIPFRPLFDAFAAAGKSLYLVGGCVRDAIMGREPKDFDFTTAARPEETERILRSIGWSCFPLGIKFGTIAAKKGDVYVEITTHRRDLTTGRHPDVAFTTDLVEDLERRDFAINAMAMDANGNIIDPFGGQCDLEARRIRTVGSPHERFSEDPLRILRAIRFISQLGFDIVVKTAEAMVILAPSVLLVSRERWLEEMNKLLVGSYVQTALNILEQTGVLYFILPEMWAVVREGKYDQHTLHSKNLWMHTKTVVSQSPPRPAVRWAALLHDMAKPQTRVERNGEVHFPSHEILGAEMVDGIARRLKMSNDLRRSIRGLVALHQRTSSLVAEGVVSRRAMRRLIAECDVAGCSFADLVDLFEADCSSSRRETREMVARQAEAIRAEFSAMKEEDARPRLPKGIGNLIAERFGVEGAEIGRLRDRLEGMLLDGEINSGMSPEEMVRTLTLSVVSL